MYKKILFFLILAFPVLCSGQYILGLHTTMDDSYREWVVEIEIDSLTVEEGNLELTWGLSNDFTAWQYDIAEVSGEIIQKYQNNPTYWELKSDSGIVTIKQTWRNDPTLWVITKGDLSFSIRTANRNILDEWYLTDNEMGEFIIYTEHSGDARDWLVEDYMHDHIPIEMRIAATFIVIYTSSPKF